MLHIKTITSIYGNGKQRKSVVFEKIKIIPFDPLWNQVCRHTSLFTITIYGGETPVAHACPCTEVTQSHG